MPRVHPPAAEIANDAKTNTEFSSKEEKDRKRKAFLTICVVLGITPIAAA